MLKPGLHRTAAAAVLVATSILLASVVGPTAAGADSLTDKRAKASQIADRLAALEADLMGLGAQHERVSYELRLAREEAAAAKERLEKTNSELDHRKQELQDFAVDAYQSGNGANAFDALVTSDPSVGVVKKSYLKTTTSNRKDLIESMNVASKAAEQDRRQLEQAEAETERQERELAQAKTDAQKATSEQATLNDEVQGELAELVAAEQARRAAEARDRAAATAATVPATESSSTTPGAAPQTTTRGTGATGTTGSTPTPPAAPTTTPTTSRPSNPTPAPQPPAPQPPKVDVAPPPPSGSRAQGAISAALSKVGAPYVWGAGGPNSFDCSGLVMWAYAQVGISLPHYSGAQYQMTTRISASQLQPGDLVFWGPGGSEHVAIYMGGDQLVHAFGSNGGTGVTRLQGWWKAPSGYGRLHY